MKTLKQLTDMQHLTGQTDMEIIYEWFVANNKEADGIAMISQLAQAQTKKLEERLNYARSWIPCVPAPSVKDSEAKDYLYKIIKFGILDCDLKDHYYVYEWAKEHIPKMETPSVFFMPTLGYLQKYGIEFKMSVEEREENIRMGFMR